MQMRVLREYFREPNMTVENLQTISTAGAGLLRWVVAMMNYYGVYRVVAPKRAAVASAERNLAKAQKELETIQNQVCESV
jgi:dynein heavy chain